MEKTGKVSQQRPDKAKEHGDFDARLQDAIRSHLKEWRVGVARTRDELRHSCPSICALVGPGLLPCLLVDYDTVCSPVCAEMVT